MVTENTIQDGESTEASGEPTLEDLQAQLKTSEASNKKLENDLRSERGQQNQGFSKLVEDFGEMVVDFGGMKAQITAIGNRTASGETESLPADFAAIDQERAVTTATRNWENNYKEAELSLAEALVDDGDDVILDKEAIARLSTLWKEAQTKGDVPGLYRVVGQAGKETRAVVKQRFQTEAAEVEEAAKTAKKTSDAKNGVGNVSVGVPSGMGSGVKSRTQIENETDVKNISKEDYEAYVAGG